MAFFKVTKDNFSEIKASEKPANAGFNAYTAIFLVSAFFLTTLSDVSPLTL